MKHRSHRTSRIASFAVVIGFCTLIISAGQAQTILLNEVQKLMDSDPGENQAFGGHVVIDGDTMAVGAGLDFEASGERELLA